MKEDVLVFISEVGHVAVRCHVINVEEQKARSQMCVITSTKSG